MAVLAQFGNMKFEITSNTARLFEKMKLSAECETEDSNSDAQKYVSIKNGNPAQLTVNIILNASLGLNVRDEVIEILNSAQRGRQDYFYIGGKKLFPFQMMMVSAQTEEIQTAPSGVWVFATVNITLKQSSKEWIIGQPQKNTASARNNTSNGKKTEMYVKPIYNNSGAKIYAPASSFQNTVMFDQTKDVMKMIADAKSTPSPISMPQPLSHGQKAWAKNKEGQLLGFK